MKTKTVNFMFITAVISAVLALSSGCEKEHLVVVVPVQRDTVFVRDTTEKSDTVELKDTVTVPDLPDTSVTPAPPDTVETPAATVPIPGVNDLDGAMLMSRAKILLSPKEKTLLQIEHEWADIAGPVGRLNAYHFGRLKPSDVRSVYPSLRTEEYDGNSLITKYDEITWRDILHTDDFDSRLRFESFSDTAFVVTTMALHKSKEETVTGQDGKQETIVTEYSFALASRLVVPAVYNAPDWDSIADFYYWITMGTGPSINDRDKWNKLGKLTGYWSWKEHTDACKKQAAEAKKKYPDGKISAYLDKFVYYMKGTLTLNQATGKWTMTRIKEPGNNVYEMTCTESFVPNASYQRTPRCPLGLDDSYLGSVQGYERAAIRRNRHIADKYPNLTTGEYTRDALFWDDYYNHNTYTTVLAELEFVSNIRSSKTGCIGFAISKDSEWSIPTPVSHSYEHNNKEPFFAFARCDSKGQYTELLQWTSNYSNGNGNLYDYTCKTVWDRYFTPNDLDSSLQGEQWMRYYDDKSFGNRSLFNYEGMVEKFAGMAVESSMRYGSMQGVIPISPFNMGFVTCPSWQVRQDIALAPGDLL